MDTKGDNSDTSSCTSSDSESSDNEQFAKKKQTPQRKNVPNPRKKLLAKRKVTVKKSKKLTKAQITDLCDKLKDRQMNIYQKVESEVRSNWPTLLDKIQDGRVLELFCLVFEDFLANYKNHKKYEDFQIKLFFGMNDYLHNECHKCELVNSLFGDKDECKRIFPSIYQIICDACQDDILLCISDEPVGPEKTMLEEDKAQLLKMHGWVLHKLLTKSKHKELLSLKLLINPPF